MKERFNLPLHGAERLSAGMPARILDEEFIPDTWLPALKNYRLVPGEQYLIVATDEVAGPDGTMETVAYVGPLNLSEKDLNEFNMDEFAQGTRFHQIVAMPMKFLKPVTLN